MLIQVMANININFYPLPSKLNQITIEDPRGQNR